MNRQKTLEHVRRILLDSHPRLNPSHVTESASLIRDLDLDLPHLEALFSRLRSEVVESGRSFTPWYTQALRSGHDTVRSLVDFVVDPKSAWRELGKKVT